MIAISPEPRLLLAGAIAIPLVPAARAASVGAPLLAMRPIAAMGRLAMPTLAWGGLRGGISIALALSLPEGPFRTVILAANYVNLLFSVIIQGGSIDRVVQRLSDRQAAAVRES